MTDHDPSALPFIDMRFEGLQIRRVAGHIGGEVTNLALRPDMSQPHFESLHAALLAHKVLFFRSQRNLDAAGLLALGARFGRVMPQRALGDCLNAWHTELSYADVPPKISIVRALSVPGFGSDTVWANAVHACEQLPAATRRSIERMWAVHSSQPRMSWPSAGRAHRASRSEAGESAVHEAEHPVVHVHPETGERALLLGHFVRKMIGLSGNESMQVLAGLQSRVTRLDNTVRWAWRAGDVAIWDNRSTQHFAIDDQGDPARVMQRVSVQGEPAVSLDGQTSRQRGTASALDHERIDRMLAAQPA